MSGEIDKRPLDRRQIAATVHGEYLVSRPAGPGPWPLLVGFHGYGETAADHLAELAGIPGTEDWLLCAVQGLNAFYKKSGDVVASWMTRHNRGLWIADNVTYVTDVVAEVCHSYPTTGTLVYAGFSQGTAMAYRAAASGLASRGLIVLGGDLPPDVVENGLAALPQVLIGRGEDDVWYNAGKLEADLEALAGGGVTATQHVFPGGHEWTSSFRERAGQFLDRLTAH